MGVGPTIELEIKVEIERVDHIMKPWKIVDKGTKISSEELGSVEFLLSLISSETIPLPMTPDEVDVGEKFRLEMKMEVYEFKMDGMEELEVNWDDNDVVCLPVH